MIKKLLKTSLAALLAMLSLVGCEDLLDKQPIDELVQEDFWQTEADVNSALISCYVDLKGCMEEILQWSMVRADICSYGSKIKNCLQIQYGIITPKYEICKWGDFYRLINDCNFVIRFAPEVVDIDADFTESDLNEALSEAYTLRALAYYYLVRTFDEVPLILTPSESDEMEFNIPKSSANDILTQIEKDLEFAGTHGKEYFSSLEATKGRLTKHAANAILSDVYLWHDKFQECVETSDRVIESHAFSLVPQAEWWNIFAWDYGNTTESIFELQYSKTHNEPSPLRNWFSPYSHRIVGNRLVIDNVMESLDPRRPITLGGVNGIAPWKHVGVNATTGNYISGTQHPNWVFYRLPHVMFNKAEALNRLRTGGEGDDQRLLQVTEILNDVNDRLGLVYDTPKSNDVGSVEEKIIEERLLELAYEGTRWFDLVRIGRRQIKDGVPTDDNILIRSIVDATSELKQSFVKGNIINEESWVLPIYENELERNKNLVQNPYYENL